MINNIAAPAGAFTHRVVVMTPDGKPTDDPVLTGNDYAYAFTFVHQLISHYLLCGFVASSNTLVPDIWKLSRQGQVFWIELITIGAN